MISSATRRRSPQPLGKIIIFRKKSIWNTFRTFLEPFERIQLSNQKLFAILRRPFSPLCLLVKSKKRFKRLYFGLNILVALAKGRLKPLSPPRLRHSDSVKPAPSVVDRWQLHSKDARSLHYVLADATW